MPHADWQFPLCRGTKKYNQQVLWKLQSVLVQCTLPYFKIGKIARDIGVGHSESPHVAWPVIMCCISHFLCHPKTHLWLEQEHWGRCSMPQVQRKPLPLLACFVSSGSYCCVLSSGFHRSAWTFRGICMKLLPNAFVGPVRRGVEPADGCHLKQTQAFPSQQGCRQVQQYSRPGHDSETAKPHVVP